MDVLALCYRLESVNHLRLKEMLLFFYFEEVKTRAQPWPLIFYTVARLYIYIIQAVLKLPRLAQRQKRAGSSAVILISFH